MAGNPWFRLELNEHEVRNLLEDPNGPVGRQLLTKAGQVVTAGAKRRARVRTGTARDSMGWQLGQDEQGLYVDIGTVFYQRFLEKPARQLKRPRRALRPALRDLRKNL